MARDGLCTNPYGDNIILGTLAAWSQDWVRVNFSIEAVHGY